MSLKILMLTSTVSCLAIVSCVQSPAVSKRFPSDSAETGTLDAAVSTSIEPSAAGSASPIVPPAKPGPGANPTPGVLPPPVLDAGHDAKMDVPDEPFTDGSDCVTGDFCRIHEPDNLICGKLELKTDIHTELKHANILVVFDRSGSMQVLWGGVPKYESAGNALVAALTPLASQLTVGGVFFPSPVVMMPPPTVDKCPNGCDPLNLDHWLPTGAACCLDSVQALDTCPVNRIDQPDQIDFTPAAMFVAGLPTHWSLNDPTGQAGTPLERGIMRASEAIGSRTFTESLLILVMTDGEPNCGSNQDHVIQQVTAWKNANIETYVVGLPGAQPAADFLNQMARVGGTETFIDPKNPQELEARLRTVIERTVRPGFPSCTFDLQSPAEAPEKLHLFVTENGAERDVPRDAGWMVNAAGDQVTLEGQLCKTAMSGAIEGVRFMFGCKDIPPVEPPPPEPKPD